MADTSERADIQEQVQGVAVGSGRHSPTWRTPARGQIYRSRYRQADTVQHGGHQREGRHTGAGTGCSNEFRQTQSNMVDTSERADIQEQVQSGRHSPTWRTPLREHTYRSRYGQADTVQHGGHQREGRHTGAGTVKQTQSNMADTSERADIQEQLQYRQTDTVQYGGHQLEGRHTGAGTVRQTQSNMAGTSERADIQEQVQSGRHSPTWRTPLREQTYRSRYSQADTVQHGGHQREGRHTGAGIGCSNGSGRHSPTWRTPARGQTYTSRYSTGRHSPTWRTPVRGQT